MARNLIGKIGLVNDNDLRFVLRNASERLVDIGGMLNYVIDTDDPNALPVPLKWQGSIAQNLDAVAREDLIDHIAAVVMVVIAKHSQHWTFSEPLKNLGTRFGMTRVRDSVMAKQWRRDEVAGQDDQIWLERTSDLNRTFHLWLSNVRAEMDVGDLGDAESVERFWQPWKANGDPLYNRIFRFK